MSETLRAALAVFDDAVLETLANKGLVRRAAKDVEAGKADVRSMAGDSAIVVIDGETVGIDAAGPAKARCTCPAKDVCRHRIAAVMALRTPLPASEPEQTPTGPAPTSPSVITAPDPLAELLAVDLEAVAKWTGKAALRAALELIEGMTPAVQSEGAALVVQMFGHPDVRYLAGLGLDGMLSKATAAKRKVLHAAAVLAVRRLHGLDIAAIAAPPASDDASPEPRDRRFHASVRLALEDAAGMALAQAPLVLEERLFELSVSSRADRLPRLAGMLREISALVHAKRRHDFTLVPFQLLSQIATAYALNDALDQDAPPEELADLQGEVRQKYSPSGPLTLHGLGADFWQTKAGARGVTGYFYASELGRVTTLSHARGSRHDATFDPVNAYTSEPVWSAAPLQTLLRSRIKLDGVSLSPDGRLSAAGDVKATIEPAVPVRAEALAWSVTSHDWEHLERTLQRRFNGALTGSIGAGSAILLAPAGHARVTFNATTQEHTWPIADPSGRWIGLSLRHGDADEMTAARMQRLSSLADVSLILVLPRLDGDKINLIPVSVIAATPSEPKQRLFLLQRDGRGYEQPSLSMRLAWMAQLAKKPHAAAPVIATLNPLIAASPGRLALLSLADALMGLAELGGRPLDPSQRRLFAFTAEKLSRYGLTGIATSVTHLAQTEPGIAVSRAAFLRCVHLVDRARAMTRHLPWLAI
ncbi:MAG: SWIM zinc finger family protein [Hyphomicrobiaceae bacterium]